ncbi:chemotaxis protein CheW [Paucibacter aquatile]|uniref:Chemotaxis protein CheW n=1 Tax=Kinneretia aquatilis TaxID=2070761 RepID=A0A2N8L145_9BURK|nr:chemotaxis protein CheW [Paucibacter aquatile]PND39392.1 chemotaxis protein CheW [Paucibacter aquatile]
MSALQVIPETSSHTLSVMQEHLDRGRSQEFLSCQLGGVSYGIPLRCVQEIRSYEAPTQIANAPAWVKGIVDLRGVIVPIVDLRMSFGLPQVNYDALTVTVVLHLRERVIGVVVDSVSDVLALSGPQIKPAPSFSQALDAGYIAGIGTPDAEDTQRMLILLDIERLLGGAAMGLLPAEMLALN